MDILPKILIEADKNQEISLFSNFLNHPEFPGHRKMILQVFPNLKKIIESGENEKKAVTKFVDQFYSKHNIDISSAIKESTEEMKESPKVLRALGEAMEYSWPENVTYIAIPTILPFSPFNGNTFYFSILGRITKKEKKNVLMVAIHEISHFIFFEMLKEIENTEQISLNFNTRHYLKESLTAAIFNEEPLRSSLKIKDDYLGNPEIRDIHIKGQESPVKSIVEYIREKYTESKNNDIKFTDFLKDIILSFNRLSEKFSKKRQIWNQCGKELFKNEITLADYKQPMEV